MWSVNNDNGYNICRSSFDASNNFIIRGAKVYEVSTSGNVFEYDFSQQKAGMYFIKIETAKGVETKQVTVL
jgi:hypothetical protein